MFSLFSFLLYFFLIYILQLLWSLLFFILVKLFFFFFLILFLFILLLSFLSLYLFIFFPWLLILSFSFLITLFNFLFLNCLFLSSLFDEYWLKFFVPHEFSEDRSWMSNFGKVTVLIDIEKIYFPKVFLIFKELKEKSSFSNNLISVLRSVPCKVCINKASRQIIIAIIPQFSIGKIGTEGPKLIIMSCIYPCIISIFFKQFLSLAKDVFCRVHRKKILIFLIYKWMLMNSDLFEFDHDFIITQKNQVKKRISPFLYKLAVSFSSDKTILKALIPLVLDCTIGRDISYWPCSWHSLGRMKTEHRSGVTPKPIEYELTRKSSNFHKPIKFFYSYWSCIKINSSVMIE